MALAPAAIAQLPSAESGFLHLPVTAVAGNIQGIAVGPAGLVYTTDSAAAVREIDPVTGVQRLVLGGLPLASPGGIVFGDGRPLTGTDLVVADWNTEMTSSCCDGRVLRIDPSSGSTAVLAVGNPAFAGVGDPAGVALGPGGAFGDFVYVMDFQGASPNPPVLYRIDSAGTASTFLVDPAQWTTSTAPRDLAFGPPAFGGDLFVADRTGPGRLWQVSPGGTLAAFLTGHAIVAVAAPPSAAGGWGDYLYFLAANGSVLDLLRVDPIGTVELVVPAIGSGVAYAALEFRPDGKALYAGVRQDLVAVFPATMQLTVSPNPVLANQTLQLVTTGGVPGSPALIVADRLNALWFVPPSIVAYGGMDAGGSWTFGFPVPAGLAGIDVRAQAVSLDASQHYIASQKELVMLR